MVLGVRPGAANESVALTSEASVHVPHELPGQDPEGGSEVNFGDGDASAAATPRETSQGGAEGHFNTRVSFDGVPRSPKEQVKGKLHCCLARQPPHLCLCQCRSGSQCLSMVGGG